MNNMFFHMVVKPLFGPEESIKKFEETFRTIDYDSLFEEGFKDRIEISEDNYHQHIIFATMHSRGYRLAELASIVGNFFPDITFSGIVHIFDRVNVSSEMRTIVIRGSEYGVINSTYSIDMLDDNSGANRFLVDPENLMVIGKIDNEKSIDQIQELILFKNPVIARRP